MKTFDAFTLKIIAIVGMAMQHTAIALGEVIPTWLHFPLQFGGGFTFPIMAFFLVEGYRHTSNLKGYMWRLGIFGLISQIPFIMAFSSAAVSLFSFNIMFTLLIGLLLLVMYDKMRVRWLFWILFVLIAIFTLFFDWPVIGPVVILLYHAMKDDKLRRIIAPLVASTGMLAVGVVIGLILVVAAAITGDASFLDILDSYASQGTDPLAEMAWFFFPLGSLPSILLLLRFNGERGRRIKYLFYAFYPGHLLVLGLIALALGLSDLSTIWPFA